MDAGLYQSSGLIQEQLAKRAGVPLASPRGHEQGQRIPNWVAVVRLARALGVSTDVFAECDEVRSEPTDEETRRRRSDGRKVIR
ncbi:MAG: helix-turn-helix transcriptional regulator [Planctomycetia bacterium]|nr:helix-turn-helix transcriptional regulator [Planctomycetia bacterium]